MSRGPGRRALEAAFFSMEWPFSAIRPRPLTARSKKRLGCDARLSKTGTRSSSMPVTVRATRKAPLFLTSRLDPCNSYVFEALIVPTYCWNERQPVDFTIILCHVIDRRISFGMLSNSHPASYCDEAIHSTGRIFNATILHMHLFTSRERRKVEKKAEERAKARSDEIDLRLREEARSSRRLCNVLLMSSCPRLVIYVRCSYNLR
jgi:hypothetical protein